MTPDTSSDLRSSLLALLNLTPAEGATEISDEQVLASVTDLVAKAGQVEESATSLAAAQAELEKVSGEYRALYEREEQARKKVEEAAADETISQYADRLATPEAKARMRALLLQDRAGAIEILNGLAPAAAETKAGAVPPKPTHAPDAAAASAPDEEDLAAQIKARAQALQAATPGLSWADAWARAEKALRAAA